MACLKLYVRALREISGAFGSAAGGAARWASMLKLGQEPETDDES